MRKLLAIALAVAVLLACGSALAKAYEPVVITDHPWWGNTGAKPDPVKDTTRSGYWWYPKAPEGSAGGSELWGNRGKIYAMYAPKPPVEPPKVEPPKVEPKKVVRQTPVFNNVLFDFDKSNLKPEGKAEADKVLAGMKEHAKDALEIEGHTCDIGDDAYNMALGQRRADAVKKYMVENGIDAGRVTTKSYGETKPAQPNANDANRKLNRRAMFNITIHD